MDNKGKSSVFGSYPRMVMSDTNDHGWHNTSGFLARASRKKLKVKREELEERFLDAGWELDGSFESYLLIGHDGERVSLLAHREHWGTDNPVFELLDHEDMSTYWVEEVPTPQQAAQLLQEHGQPAETWDMP